MYCNRPCGGGISQSSHSAMVPINSKPDTAGSAARVSFGVTNPFYMLVRLVHSYAKVFESSITQGKHRYRPARVLRLFERTAARAADRRGLRRSGHPQDPQRYSPSVFHRNHRQAWRPSGNPPDPPPLSPRTHSPRRRRMDRRASTARRRGHGLPTQVDRAGRQTARAGSRHHLRAAQHPYPARDFLAEFPAAQGEREVRRTAIVPAAALRCAAQIIGPAHP